MNMRNKTKGFNNSQYQGLEMGALRRGLWYFTNRLGLDFTLTLMLSLLYQLFVALFIALRGMNNLPLISSLYAGEWPGKVLALVISLVLAGLIQGLVVAEMAQVVWLRYPERLNIRLMAKSVWWYIITIALIITLTFDFVLLLLATTEQNNLFKAFGYMLSANQFTGILVFLLSVLNFLTILRCASVMRTSTPESTSQNLQEYLVGIAQDTLVTASDTVHRQTALLWKSLGVAPDRLIPLHNSVIDFILASHADKLPQQLPGSAWAYDWKGNRLVVVPHEIHAALMQNKEQFSQRELPTGKPGNGSNAHSRQGEGESKGPDDIFWKMSASEQAEMINLNLATVGRPDVVDATDPDRVRYITPPVPPTGSSTQSTPTTSPPATTARNVNNTSRPKTSATKPTTQPKTVASASPTQPKPSGKLPELLSHKEREEFADYLTELYEQEYGEELDQDEEGSIFALFEQPELEEYYSDWKENARQVINGTPSFSRTASNPEDPWPEEEE